MATGTETLATVACACMPLAATKPAFGGSVGTSFKPGRAEVPPMRSLFPLPYPATMPPVPRGARPAR